MRKAALFITFIAVVMLCACGYLVVEQRESLPGWMRGAIDSLSPVAHAERQSGSAPVAANPLVRGTPPPVVIHTPPPSSSARNKTPDMPFEPLANGARGDEVKAIQSRLVELGFTNERADGIYGPKTEEAVRTVQKYLHERSRADAGEEAPQAPGEIADDEEIDDAALPPEDSTIDVYDGADDIGSGAEDDEIPEPDDADAVVFTGVVDEALNDLLLADNSAWIFGLLEKGSNNADVHRLQTRLLSLNYLYKGVDGIFGSKTGEAVKAFQKQNKLAQTGIADHETQRVLYSQSAKKSPKPPMPYVLRINVSKQRVYAYSWSDADGDYTKLVRTMTCSTGLKATPTPTGTFTSGGPVARWGYFPKWDVYAQYLFRIKGPILFHSVLYRKADEKTLIKSSLNNLGRRASHGCVRLSVEDAKWIYNNCPAGTKVIVS